jgi:hypothetical protein
MCSRDRMQAFGVFRHVDTFVFHRLFPQIQNTTSWRGVGTSSARGQRHRQEDTKSRERVFEAKRTGLQANCGVTPIFTRPSTNGRSTTLDALSEVTCGRFTRWSHSTRQEAGGKHGSSYSRTRSNIFCMCLIWTYNRVFAFSSCSLNLNTHHNAYLNHL